MRSFIWEISSKDNFPFTCDIFAHSYAVTSSWRCRRDSATVAEKGPARTLADGAGCWEDPANSPLHRSGGGEGSDAEGCLEGGAGVGSVMSEAGAESLEMCVVRARFVDAGKYFLAFQLGSGAKSRSESVDSTGSGAVTFPPAAAVFLLPLPAEGLGGAVTLKVGPFLETAAPAGADKAPPAKHVGTATLGFRALDARLARGETARETLSVVRKVSDRLWWRPRRTRYTLPTPPHAHAPPV